MGEDQIGWFVGGLPTFERMIDNSHRINDSQSGGRWIIVPATKCLADVAYTQWFEDDSVDARSSAVTMWHDDTVTFCVPERLHELAGAIIEQAVPVAGIILLDPNCIVHRGRGFGKGRHRIGHDRPQLLVNFRSKVGVGTWSPPLIVMSCRKAAAVSTMDITRIYGLEAMQFIEGATLRCGLIEPKPQQNLAKVGQVAFSIVSPS